MVSQTENRESNEDEAALELHKLQQAAKLAAIYYSEEGKFERRTDLSHIVHASLHCVQFIMISCIELFHHVHYYMNQLAHEEDWTIPLLPEERNPIFFMYPICMLVSIVLAVLWFVKKILPGRPMIPLAACTIAAILMLVAGITEMKQADIYIDVTLFTDEEILDHPIFIHNFVMCILSLFVMTMYLIQTWVLVDEWQWVRRQQGTSTSADTQSSDSSVSSDVTDTSITGQKIDESEAQVGELAPIPTLQDLSTPVMIADNVDLEDEPIIYCCFVDWYNYIKMKMKSKPKHEFQVVHIM
ncbi:uncharacterized protein [Linepithema humile]|uniref:uncharacterized protein n=1 Tax=Linepithema humile TaxID=83485 RepID=UPI00351E44F0